MSVVVVELMGKVVDKVSARLTPRFQAMDANITGVHYLHGHPREIIETLIQRDNSNNFMFKKYPLVALFQDFAEEDNESDKTIEARLHMVICRATLPDYKAEERYEKNFKPFLYPIYEELKKELMSNPNVLGYAPLKLTKYDRLYWGRQIAYAGGDMNRFQDYLDAIEIINLTIKINTTCQKLIK